MRRVEFDVSPDVVRAWFRELPDGAELISIRMEPAGRWATFTFHDPALPEADEPHRGCPSWTEHRVAFNGWGIP